MSEISFFMPMQSPPTTTFQNKGLGTYVDKKTGKTVAYLYDRQETKMAKQLLLDHLAQHRPDKKMRGALRLETKWIFPFKDSDDKSCQFYYHTDKPDTDNLEKMLKDCMAELDYFEDDKFICEEEVGKYRSEITGIFVKLYTL